MSQPVTEPLPEKAVLDLYASLCELRPADRPVAALEALSSRSGHANGMSAMTLGDANRLFWSLRPSGRAPVQSQLQCVGCGDWLELPLPAGFAVPDSRKDRVTIEHDGRTYTLRQPTHADLVTGMEAGGPPKFPVEVLSPGAPWKDADFRDKAAMALDKADPGLDLVFDVTCEQCGTETRGQLDPFAFFWSALKVRANALLNEITRLASAFGWSEQDCLAVSPSRRRLYLERLS